MHLLAHPGEQGKVRNVMKQKKRSLVRRIAALGLCLALTASALSPLAFAQDGVTVEAIPDASQMQPAESAAQDEPETRPAEEVVPAVSNESKAPEEQSPSRKAVACAWAIGVNIFLTAGRCRWGIPVITCI